jgi:hypothetical protein
MFQGLFTDLVYKIEDYETAVAKISNHAGKVEYPVQMVTRDDLKYDEEDILKTILSTHQTA